MLQFVKCETLLSESNCDQQHLNIVAKRKTAENGIASDFDKKQRCLTAQCCFCTDYTNERALYIFSKVWSKSGSGCLDCFQRTRMEHNHEMALTN